MKEKHKGSWVWLLSDLYSMGHFQPAVSGLRISLAGQEIVASGGLFFSINCQENPDNSFRWSCQH